MARVSGALQNQGGPFRRLFVGIVYFPTRRRLDRVIMPVQVTAHHPQIFGGYILMEQSQMGRKLIDHKLKGTGRTPRCHARRMSVWNGHRLCRRQRTRPGR
jgi:hypothetical protein